MVAHTFGIWRLQTCIEQSQFTTGLCPCIDTHLSYPLHRLHAYFPTTGRSHEIHLQFRMDVIPIYFEPPILLNRYSNVKVTVIRLETTVSPVLDLYDCLILCPLLYVHFLLHLSNDVTCPHTPSALILKPSPRTCLTSHLFPSDSIVNLRLSTTRKTSREGLTHTLRTRLIP